ncbi:30S ribosomal protein S9P [Haladaptatus paucihalophilus DX253]|uniref:Small ribosomal subunit protein uS9 n=1 Tax=Haladaptatus paucihalophilus DX253 TaxID=797209 RepID=E7QSE3_HALPU|nr:MULTISPECIES: 30S ribosomal protein S9 [Haladaptatus]EFW92912.1 30S ribosomal protein S9P [Haladaptatus paucihalophilus DX253]ODR79121.1 30S ribosomal protein S9 [Haladaptatus sp. W1]GKZ13492.1 30S ribosomal protein S9 [Haladaptatus sp. T7]SHK09075.1 small subunit ribosomal protein S9 [Haladaptatus paucihalophilus DX253]
MVTNTSGKKKTAIARATVTDGEGRVRINSKPVELVEPEMARLKMLEPFRIAGDEREEVDVEVSVSGGGITGQADAVRTAIARGLVQYMNDAELRDAFMEFDRSLLVNDVRQSEPKKWGGPGARARYQKSYR